MNTVEIPLTKGKFAVIDASDLHIVAGFEWHVGRKRELDYAESIINGRTVLMHRLLMNAEQGDDVDHRDSNGLNNVRSNLRVCTRQQNMMNRRKLKIGSSRYKGVCLSKPGRTRPWLASIKINRKSKNLGWHATEEDAARAYDKSAKELFGEFAHLNFPELQTV